MTHSNNHLRVPAIAWMAAAAFLVSAPMLFLGNAWGYDFDFHTAMWMNAAQQFAQGIALPRWGAGMNGGFGEPFLIFYPPLSWMAGGLLGLLAPWRFAGCAFVFSTLMLAGAAAWKLARLWLEPRDALAAALLYTLNPYMMVNIYKRSNFGEFLAGALFPLLVWAAIRVARDGRKMVPALVIVFAAIWLADLPEAMVASYSLALLLAAGSVLQRSPRPLLWGSIAIVSAFACLAFFLLPALWERPWVEIGRVLGPEWSPENNFIFTTSSEPVMAQFSHAISAVAVFLVATTLGAAALTGRFRVERPAIWYALAALGTASAILLFRPSWILWQILPSLRYVEYPYRWLTPLAVANALLIASAIAERGGKRWLRAAAVGGFAALAVAMMFTVRWDTGNRHINQLAADMRAGTGFRFTESKDWRLPLRSRPSLLPDGAPLVAAPAEIAGVRIDVRQWAPEHKAFTVVTPQPTLLKIKLLNYPAWQARLDGRAAPLRTDPETGQMLLPAPAGSTQAEITFTRTWDRTAGILVTLASVLLLGLLGWRYRGHGDAGPGSILRR